MPIVIPQDIPAYKIMQQENVFVMKHKRASSQDIRPLEIAILNLMPTKEETETQFIRLLSNSPIQVNLTLIKTSSYTSKNTSAKHLNKFYKEFKDIKNRQFDGMIITGAPVETMEFTEVLYWNELKEILTFAKKRVTSSIYICWGAQAALYSYYGIQKYNLDKKMFGIFKTAREDGFDPLLKGVDDVFNIPHSRHTYVREEDIRNCKHLQVLASGKETGPSIIKSTDNKGFFLFGHSEYDYDTLKKEYLRDLNKGLKIDKPENYFVNDNLDIEKNWSSAANLIFSNWLNYYVYQVTPYDYVEEK